MSTVAERILAFNRSLDFDGPLPEGVQLLNPFRENPLALPCSEAFYRKYYSDNGPRRLILGINPGRFGAGLTGVPFTDPKRLVEVCGIPYPGKPEHEPSSAYIYDMIAAYGGPEAFYGDCYIHSVCPLGFTATGPKGSPVNLNYYDRRDLTEAVLPFIRWNIAQQIGLAGRSAQCYVLGTGQNFKFLQALNAKEGYFGELVPLEHPRFIMQYRAKSKATYIEGYLKALRR